MPRSLFGRARPRPEGLRPPGGGPVHPHETSTDPAPRPPSPPQVIDFTPAAGDASSGRRRASHEQRLLDIVAGLHPKLIRAMDASKVAELDSEAFRVQLGEFLASEQAELPDLGWQDRQHLVQILVDDIKGLGPLEPLLQDARVSDILVNGMHSVYVERMGRLERVDVRFRDAGHLVTIAQRIASSIGRRIDESSPMVDARLGDGSRVNIIIPPLAIDGVAISIRRFTVAAASLDDLAEQQVCSPAMAEALKIAVRARCNILISGGTGAGKTTFMNALSREIPGDERLVTIEDAAELKLQQPHVVRLETRTASTEGAGRISMQELLFNTLRMRPDRIIVGEVRGAEANEMLQAMNTGHPGSMSTIHANTARDALDRLESMLMAANRNLPLMVLRKQIASSIDMLIQLRRLRTGHRCCESVTNVVGTEGDVITTEEMWARRPDEEEHVFETSGRQPPWMRRAEEIGLRDALLHALDRDPLAQYRTDA